MTPEPQIPPKKPYAEPQLLVYGDIREITQAVGGMGNSDNGQGPMNKKPGVTRTSRADVRAAHAAERSKRPSAADF